MNTTDKYALAYRTLLSIAVFEYMERYGYMHDVDYNSTLNWAIRQVESLETAECIEWFEDVVSGKYHLDFSYNDNNTIDICLR
jgi:hypothetical protein